jgi:hypothetical protein
MLGGRIASGEERVDGFIAAVTGAIGSRPPASERASRRVKTALPVLCLQCAEKGGLADRGLPSARGIAAPARPKDGPPPGCLITPSTWRRRVAQAQAELQQRRDAGGVDDEPALRRDDGGEVSVRWAVTPGQWLRIWRVDIHTPEQALPLGWRRLVATSTEQRLLLGGVRVPLLLACEVPLPRSCLMRRSVIH